MQAAGISIRMHGDRSQSKPSRRADDATGNFAAIGDQE
jgi:hypothetical protein